MKTLQKSTAMGVFVAVSFFAPTNAHFSLLSRASAQSASDLAGTWEGQGLSDSRARQFITLELRADGTYTKTLDSVVDGKHYGGTHSGTWKFLSSRQVFLSGDGNWPSYTQDLSLLRKVK